MAGGMMEPFKSKEIKPFWDGLQEHKLLAPRCRECGESFFPPRNRCPRCLSKDLEWIQLSGRGTLHSWSRVYFPVKEPFVIGVIDLEERIGRAIARVTLGSEKDEPCIGAPVKVSFFENNGEIFFEFTVKDL